MQDATPTSNAPSQQASAQTAGVSSDTPGEIDLNPAMAWERIDSWLDGFVKLIPNILVALVVFILFYLIARLASHWIRRSFKGRDRQNLGEILGGFIKAAVLIFGALISATIIIPSLNPGSIVAGLGVSSVAIGFAFKDILQNWLAGLLILLRQPFEIGDQIEVGDYVGTVQHIETRATIIKTYDGQRAVIPNSDIYTDAVLVKTGEAKRRSQYDIGIGYGDDIEAACALIKDVLNGIDGIEQDPAPEAFAWDLAASWVTIRARWWTDSRRGDVVANRSNFILAVKKALDDAKIDMPYDTRVHLFHDQTEESDGDRTSQREGWPSPAQGKAPRPRYKVVADTEPVMGKGGSSDSTLAEPAE